MSASPIVLTAFIMVVWYGCMIVFGVWDRLDEWFYPNNIINSLIGSIIYFVVLIILKDTTIRKVLKQGEKK